MKVQWLPAFDWRIAAIKTYVLSGFVALSSWTAAFVLLLSLSMMHPLDHDEHQFVASGAILARQGLLPYRDYPYFHMPNLVFVYAGLYRWCPYLLLSSRVFSAACSASTVAILFGITSRAFPLLGRTLKYSVAIGGAACLICNPIFVYSTGKAWNHDLPILLTFLALIALWRWKQSRGTRAQGLGFACGFFFGLAMGTRLTFAPVMVAFVVSVLFGSSKTRRERGIGIVFLVGGLLLAVLPSLVLFAIAPKQFWFGIIDYPSLNKLFFEGQQYPEAMTTWGKVVYVVTVLLIQPANSILFAAFCLSWMTFRRPRGPVRHRFRFELASLGMISIILFLSSFAPTPLRVQYFFSPVPFAIAFVLLAAADSRLPGTAIGVFMSVSTALVAAYDIQGYQDITRLIEPQRWIPYKLHQSGIELSSRTREGRILTFGPIIPLEGGCSIYPELVTGPFAVRIADFVPENERALLRIVGEKEFEAMLSQRPADAVIRRSEPDLDQMTGRHIVRQNLHRVPGWIGEEFEHEELWLRQ